VSNSESVVLSSLPPVLTARESWTTAVSRNDVARSLFERSGIAMATLDLKLHLVEATNEFVKPFGIRPTHIRGRSFFELLHPSLVLC
jgi:hypothetical protein